MEGMLFKFARFWRMYLLRMRTTVRPSSTVTLAPSPFLVSTLLFAQIHLLPARKNTVSFSVFHFSSPSSKAGLFK